MLVRSKTLLSYIGGEWIASSTTTTQPVYNPVTGDIIAEVPLSTKDSFYGYLHANGTDGVEFYTRKKMLTARYQ